MTRAALLALGLAIVTATAKAEDAPAPAYLTAGDIYRDCHPVTTDNPVQFAAYVRCIGYIDGAASMARIYTLALKLNELCIPPGTQSVQIVDVVLGYIASKPDVRDAQGSIAVYAALRDAYPCPAK